MLDLLKFDITARDRASSHLTKMKGELGGIRGALAGVNDHARRAGRSMRRIGAGMSVGITAPLMMLGKQSVQLYDQQVKAEAAVQQAITSTGGAAGRTIGDLKGLASALQGVTTFGDEDILRDVTAPMLTFTKVQGETFDRAQANVLDMATLLKMDLKSASILVGKALNDPVKGLSALSRSGVQFSDDQKNVIKALVETGDVAGAQALILQELETQFKGQAAAAASAPLGQWKQLSNAIGDVKEELGAEVVPFLKPLVVYVKDAVKWFGELSPETKKNIVVFGGLAAAAGPVVGILGMTAIGIAGLTTALTGMGAALLANPIFLAIAAVAGGAYLIYRNWDGIKAWFGRVWDGVRERTETGWAAIKDFLLTVTPAGLIYRNWDGIAEWFTGMWAEVQTGFSVAWSGIKGILAGRYSRAQLIDALWATLPRWFQGLWPQVVQTFRDGWQAVKETAAQWAEDFAGIGREIVEGLKRGITEKWDALVGWFNQKWDELVGEAKDFLGIRSPSRVFKGIGADIVGGLVQGLAENGEKATEEMRGIAGALVEASDVAGQVDRQFGTTFSGIVRGASSARDALSRLADSLADKILSNTFTDLFGGLGIGKLLGGLIGSAKGNVFSGGSLIPFANGGVVGRPTLFPMSGSNVGLMGEAGPEAILPLSRGTDGKLGVQAGGGQRIELVVHAAEGVTVEQVGQISRNVAVRVSQASAAAQQRGLGRSVSALQARGVS